MLDNMGNYDRQDHQGTGYQIKEMEAQPTNRQTTSVQYISNPEFIGDGGYKVTEVNAPNTNRQFTADIEYQEGATDDQILDFAFGEYQKSLETPSQNLFSDSLFRQGIVQEDAVEEEEEEELGFFEGAGDVLTNIATGVTTGTKAITSGLVGVDNAISDSLNDTQEYLQSYLSAQAKADQQEMGRIQQEEHSVKGTLF